MLDLIIIIIIFFILLWFKGVKIANHLQHIMNNMKNPLNYNQVFDGVAPESIQTKILEDEDIYPALFHDLCKFDFFFYLPPLIYCFIFFLSHISKGCDWCVGRLPKEHTLWAFVLLAKFIRLDYQCYSERTRIESCCDAAFVLETTRTSERECRT